MRRDKVQCSGNDIIFSNLAEEINYSIAEGQPKKTYAYAGGTAFYEPGSTIGTPQFALGITNKSGKWNYLSDGKNWSEVDTKRNDNTDVYLYFKEIKNKSSFNFKYDNNKLIVNVQDINGNPVNAVTAPGDVTVGNNQKFNIMDYVNEHFYYGNGYDNQPTLVFKHVKIGTNTSQFITSIKYNNGWKYSTHYANPGKSVTNDTITIIYEPVVPTLDSVSKGITMKMYDYDAWRNGSSGNHEYGINKCGVYKFGQNLNEPFGWGTASNYCSTQGLWQNKLFSTNIGGKTYKFPKTAKYADDFKGKKWWENTNQQDKDFSYIFENDKTTNWDSTKFKTEYEDLNYFFDQKEYDDTGYFYYNSSEHFNSLVRNRSSFAQHTSAVYDPGGSNKFTVKYMPYDYFIPTKDDESYQKPQYDYMFCQTFDFDFIQPANGMTKWKDKDEGPMKFEFNGDDDVYIYIDDCLVLDIGGRHQPLPGSIDFSTGVVKTAKSRENYDDEGKIVEVPTSLRTMLSAADSKYNDDQYWKEVTYPGENGQNEVGYIFKDFTNHHMKIYYMEHNEGDSNAMFRFNMSTRPANTIQVGKSIDPRDDGYIMHRDEEYEYLVQKQPSTGGDFVNFPAAGTTYTVYKGSVGKESGIGETCTVEKDGYITLKYGEVAMLPGFEDGSRYNIYEYDPEMGPDHTETFDGYKWDFTINNEKKTVAKKEVQTETGDIRIYYGVEDLATWDYAGLQFTNHYNTQLYNLEVKRSDDLDIDSTIVQIVFNDNELYANGSYKFYSKDYPDGISLKTDNNGCIQSSHPLIKDPTTRIVVENIAMGVPVQVLTYDSASKQAINTFNFDQLSNVVKEDKSIKGDVPDMLSPIDKEVSTIILSLSNELYKDLIISETTLGDGSDPFKRFEMSAELYKGETPYDPGEEARFNGVITRNDGNTEPVNIAIHDGKIQIVTIDTTTKEYVYSDPELANSEKLTIKEIIPPDGLDVKLYEKFEQDYSPNKKTGQTDVSHITRQEVSFNLGDNIWTSESKTMDMTQANLEFHIANVYLQVPITDFQINNPLPLIALIAAGLLAILLVASSIKLRKGRR